ncbi:GFA family protein [Pseudomonadales bacterium]|nr:GFA family protein [Pseudomonadales bacterium]
MSKGLIAGSCLCGGVGYHFEGDGVLVISHCHCSMCRKASGAAFASFVMVLITDFVWTRGEQLIHKYESSKGIFRCHCSCCGSPLPLQDPHLSLMAVPAGSLDSPSCNWPHVETFTDDALPFMRNKQGGGLDSLFDDAAFEEAVFKKNVREVLADELGDASIYGSERKAEGEEASHLTFFGQSEYETCPSRVRCFSG